MLIGILITAFGCLGGVVTIFCVFFQVKDTVKISKRDMIFIILWLALTILGIANLYYICNYNNIDASKQGSNNEEVDVQETSNSKEDDNGQEADGDTPTPDPNLSPEEILINQNFDTIQQLKSNYLDTDTKIIENDYVVFETYEKAGYIYQNLMKTGECKILQGIRVPNTQVIIVDYDSDKIVRSYEADESGRVQHASDNKKFYCVVFHDNHDIYVSPPIQIVGGEKYEYFSIYLERKNSKYTPLFQLYIHIQDLVSNETYYTINYSCKDTILKDYSMTYCISIRDSVMLRNSNKTYFSLNTNYIMDIFLDFESESKLKSTHEIFNGSVTNSNLIDIYLKVESENEIEE